MKRPKLNLKSKKLWLIVIAAAIVAGGIAFLIVKDEILPEYSPMTRGYRVAEESGCFSCHGQGAIEAAFNARTPKDPSQANDWASAP